MALFSMKLENLQQLYLKELRDLYSAENQITDALPKLIDAANNSGLKNALQEHLNVTQTQIGRLEQIFQMLNEKPSGETCKGMKGVIKEGDEIVSAGGDPATVDAGIISAAQRVEHYEMAGYGTVRTYAKLLGQDQHAKLLQQTLDEEEEADETLTEIANTVNVEAKAA
jgi:ferritin-like metal-binding protein YciE